MTDKKLITAQELSVILGLSVETIWRYTREQRIPYVEMGARQYRYVEAQVLATLHKKTASALLQEEPASYVSTKKLTYEDYAKLPGETGYTLQLIEGCIVRDPAPTFLHQRVSRRLQQILIAYFAETDPKGEVFNAPLDIFLDDYTVVQPDLVYLPSTRPAKRDPIDSLPELVVEILSPSTVRTDRVRKLNCYQKAGIPHYWMVDPIDGFIQCYELQDGLFKILVSLDEGTITHPAFPGLEFELGDLFAEV